MARKFPALRGIELDYSWWGWVDVSHDMMPRITGMPDLPGAFYALGYGGNGVMYSAMAGRRMAQLVAGEAVPSLPIFNENCPMRAGGPPSAGLASGPSITSITTATSANKERRR
jgi:glycine/D-amino acid oxidase-like deaminating enzyme